MHAARVVGRASPGVVGRGLPVSLQRSHLTLESLSHPLSCCLDRGLQGLDGCFSSTGWQSVATCREVFSPPPRSGNYLRRQIVSDLGLLGGHPTDAPLVLGQASDQTTRCTQPHHAHPRSDPLLPLPDQSCDQIWALQA